tara:strand:- start:515 stop:970 length:456 start_codon:yes stop_codon:yes gene_type:complete
MTEKSEYNYSLLNLQESLREVMEGEFTPQEIHDTIVNSVKKNMRYYKACYNDSVRLLALLRGNTNKDIGVVDGNEWRRIEDPNYEEIAPGIKVEKIDGIKSEYTANEYWNGDVPEQEFEQYLQKYGYEYTPEIDTTKFKLDSPSLHNEEED